MHYLYSSIISRKFISIFSNKSIYCIFIKSFNVFFIIFTNNCWRTNFLKNYTLVFIQMNIMKLLSYTHSIILFNLQFFLNPYLYQQIQGKKNCKALRYLWMKNKNIHNNTIVETKRIWPTCKYNMFHLICTNLEVYL